ncbi:MAG: carbohydrate binding family 9 domain-containing protein [Chlorobi bacterium]|nr:carbohydrate binding family 9 domain-containing protein [Chlorobiota bacterium]
MKYLIILFIVFISVTVNSQNRIYNTHKIKEHQITVDGVFDESVWANAEEGKDFLQFEPVERAKPSQKTKFKILYDENNIYVAIQAFDTEPEKIENRLSRRDSWDGDMVVVQFDSYYDKKTAFVFAVNAAGVRNDAVTSNDNINNDDPTWDPIWTAKTAKTKYGWNAEMKIPLSQLRFSKKEHQIWGLQVGRYIFRNNEWDIWQFVSKKKAGWVSRFGTLEGLTNLNPKRQIEIAPYVSLKYENYQKEEGNPFSDGSDWSYNAGVDGKIGITNDLTLNFAVNPDFGQVEADPSEVNLTAFETFFAEKRPFFVEGSNITDYQLTPGGSPWSRDNLFYSRRIGRRPQYNIYNDLSENEYAKVPENTIILGALKLTGKTKNGWSVGVIESFTNKTYAEIDSLGNRKKEVVEPYTNYFSGRLQKDLNDGNTVVGGMLTSVNRIINSDKLDFLNNNAYTGGLDFMQYFTDKKYFLSVKVAGSNINGSTNAISEQQLSSRRYFQRPDADYLTYDSTLTSLSGFGGNLTVGKQSPKGLSYGFNISWRSPGFELNDMGYLRRANSIFQFMWVNYNITEPFSIFRSIRISTNEWTGMDFGGTSTFLGGNLSSYAQFKNLWSMRFNITKERYNIDNSLLRGGPGMKTPGSFQYNINVSSNSAKKLKFYTGFYNQISGNQSGKSYGIYGGITYQPLNALSVSLSPQFNYNNSKLQYVETVEFQNEERYIFASINQKTFVLTLRINYNITPDFTVQYYGAPFVSAADYTDYKKITNAKADQYQDRFMLFSDNQISYLPNEKIYGINETSSGDYDYYFGLPDFNYRQFRSNLVLRWEYKPGSLFYFVWSQNRTDAVSDGTFHLNQSIKEMFKISPFDVFLIKFSYRFIL